MNPKTERISQIQLPDPNDRDPHPRLKVNGYGVHCGDCFVALLPEGWTEISLEVDFVKTGPACWYIPGHSGICPVGLFVKRA